MRWIINYIRSCFCNHDWELLNQANVFDALGDGKMPMGMKWTYRCKKGGWHKIIKNY